MWVNKDLDVLSLRHKQKTKTMLIFTASAALLVNAGSMFKQMKVKQSLSETEKDKEDNNNGTSRRFTGLRDSLNWSSLGI